MKTIRILPLLRGLLRAPHLFVAGVEAEAHIPVLGILRRQLQETAGDVKSAVESVCESFAGMTQRAQETVLRAGRLLSGDRGTDAESPEEANMEQLLTTSRGTIEHLLERMERGSAISLEAVRQMEELEGSLKKVMNAVGEIDRIAFQNKILALNAKIEAVHVGELGVGFGVVADEISTQAGRSTELTGEIHGAVQALRATVETTAGKLREFADEAKDRVATSRREVRETLDAIEHAHWKMRASVSEVAERSEQLAADIARSVVALQFQDRVNQRVEHVVEALESMEQAFGGEGGGTVDREQRREQVVGRLQQTYTMESERAAAASVSDGDVELF